MHHVQAFFSRVEYAPTIAIDNSWTGLAERTAQVCLAPSEWLLNSKKYTITLIEGNTYDIKSTTDTSHGLRYVVRKVIGLGCSLPGLMIAIPLRAFAYKNPEISLKHRIVFNPFSVEQRQALDHLIKKRRNLPQERDGCEPISCFLFSIVCLLCCLVCRK